MNVIYDFSALPWARSSAPDESRPAECTLDLFAIPAPARPALAEALQAAVARLAEGDWTVAARRAGDVVLAELIRQQMAGMLREAAADGEGGR